MNELSERLGSNTMPFPSTVRIPGHTSELKALHYLIGNLPELWPLDTPRLDATLPNFPQPFPELAPILTRWLDLAEQPLNFALAAAEDLRNTLQTQLAVVNATPPAATAATSTGFPEADYLYPERVRRWLGHPVVVIGSNLLAAHFEGFQTMMVDLGDQDLDIAGEGGNLSIPVRFVPTALNRATKLINTLINNVASDQLRAENATSYAREAHIHQDLENHSDEFTKWREADLRRMIAINLAGHSNHPQPLGEFQLPARFGGYLELARDIVAETIAKMTAAGQETFNAAFWLSRGNADVAAGEYKRGYDSYRKAYLDATR